MLFQRLTFCERCLFPDVQSGRQCEPNQIANLEIGSITETGRERALLPAIG
jgi:hypothetical protein